MALLSVQFTSPALCKQTAMNVILPPGKGPFPVLYLLHGGLSDNYTAWQRHTNIERYVEGKNLMVVMPDGGAWFYCNDSRPGGYAYEDYMVNDVVGFVDGTFRTKADRRGRTLAGLSMGGYGAMMLALKHADMFSVVCAHSSVAQFMHVSDPNWPDVNVIADALPKDGRYDLFALSEKIVHMRRRIALRMDCGAHDYFLKQNRSFHAHLNKIGFLHEYREYPGAHSWDYWDIHIQQSIAFILSHLNPRKSP